MGIFSKFQIKDIKSKILGGRVKQKGGDLPAISVIPPTPSTKNNFTFPENNNPRNSAENPQENIKSNSRAVVTRQRSYSLPDCVDNNTEFEAKQDSEKTDGRNAKIYLKPPRRGRKKRKNRSRSRSCPENLGDLKNIATAVSDGMKTVGSCANFSSNEDGPNLSDASEPSLTTENFSDRKMREYKEENEEFLSEEEQHDEQICGNSSNEYLSDGDFSQSNQDNACDRSMDSSLSSFSLNNGADITIKESASDEFNDPGETTPLCAEIAAKSEISEESSKASLGARIRRRVLSSYRTTPETRWSLDLERLLAGGNQKFSEADEENQNWDRQTSDMPPIINGKSVVSTWSLDLENTTKVNCEVERAKSEICVGGSPSVRQKAETKNGEQGITNAKSLDLDLASKTERDGSNMANSETMLRTTSLKRGINGYIGKFNGIVSKFSTWSLDIETTRKTSLDGELSDSNRAHSEMLLDEVESESSQPEKSLSYHTLLYDIDEASKYQIYQPTVYDIGDEGVAVDRPDQMPVKPLGTTKTASSMKFISKQFENLYENSKNLYKQRHVIIDALKQREKELKAIADRQNAPAAKPTEQIFKPKSAPRQRSHSYHSSRQKQPKPN